LNIHTKGITRFMSDDSTFDPILLLSRLLRRQAFDLAASNACVLLINPDGTSLTIEYGMGVMEPYVGRIIQSDDGVAGYVLSTNQPQLISDYRAWARHYRRLIPDTIEAFNVVAGTPVYRHGELWAILSFIWASIDPAQEATIVNRLHEISTNATALVTRLEEAPTEAEPSFPIVPLPGTGFLPAAL
jgi:hypothetical protein